jgi:hypothetical protein
VASFGASGGVEASAAAIVEPFEEHPTAAAVARNDRSAPNTSHARREAGRSEGMRMLVGRIDASRQMPTPLEANTRAIDSVERSDGTVAIVAR